MMAKNKTWINITPKFNEGGLIINKLDNGKLFALLNKIILELKQDQGTISLFTDEEKDKLKKNFSINANELELLINCCVIILSQALHHFVSPETLKKILIEELLLEEDKAHIFFTVWTNHAKSLILKWKKKSISSCQLEDVSWLVNIEIASKKDLQTFIPKAVMELKIKEDNKVSDIKLEMNENDLYYMYNKLEDIQMALDSLS